MYRLDDIRELELPLSVEIGTDNWLEDDEDADPNSDRMRQPKDDTDEAESGVDDDSLAFGPQGNARKKFDEEDDSGTPGTGAGDDEAEPEFDDDDDLAEDDDDDDDAGFDDDDEEDADDDDDDDDDFDDMDDDD